MLRYRMPNGSLAIARIALAERAERLIPGFLRQNRRRASTPTAYPPEERFAAGKETRESADYHRQGPALPLQPFQGPGARQRLACKIFSRSISSTSAQPKAQARAPALISGTRAARRVALKVFESPPPPAGFRRLGTPPPPPLRARPGDHVQLHRRLRSSPPGHRPIRKAKGVREGGHGEGARCVRALGAHEVGLAHHLVVNQGTAGELH